MSDQKKPEPKKPEEFELTASIVGGGGYDPLRPLVVRPLAQSNEEQVKERPQ